MVEEGWSLSDVLAFIKEYKLGITVVDKDGTTIPEDKYSDFYNKIIVEQSRPKGDPIIEGINLKVKVNAIYELPKENEKEDTENEDN